MIPEDVIQLTKAEIGVVCRAGLLESIGRLDTRRREEGELTVVDPFEGTREVLDG